MAKLDVHNLDGKKTESIDLPAEIFGTRVKTEVIHQAVVMYQACLRQGTASTKERAEVSGTGKKWHRQKGTGQARVGSHRSPIWAGGGVTFGPKPRDFSYSIPKKIKKAALGASLNDKFYSKNLFCVDSIDAKFEKTKEFAKLLEKFKLEGKVVALLDDCDPSVLRASRNIPRFKIIRALDVNAYDIMKNKKLLVTKSSINNLLKRLK